MQSVLTYVPHYAVNNIFLFKSLRVVVSNCSLTLSPYCLNACIITVALFSQCIHVY